MFELKRGRDYADWGYMLRRFLAPLVLAMLLVAPAAANATFGAPELVSKGGNAAAAASFEHVTADGSKIFFTTSEALLSGVDLDAKIDLYMSEGGVLKKISPGNGPFDVSGVRASDDGAYVAYRTQEDLTTGATDTDGNAYDVYRTNTSTLTTDWVSNGGLNGPHDATTDAIASDGSRVVFETDEDLPGDTDAGNDIYDWTAATPTVLSDGTAGGAVTFQGASADASAIVFSSPNPLEAGGVDNDAGVSDLYRASGGVIRLVSREGGAAGSVPTYAGMSDDGGAVFFTTADNIDAGDGDGVADAYRWTAATPTTPNWLTGQAGTPGPTAVGSSALRWSTDGSVVAFGSTDPLVLADANVVQDVYEWKPAPGTPVLVSDGGAGSPAAFLQQLSADGSLAYYETTLAVPGSGDVDANNDGYATDGVTTTLVTPGTPGSLFFLRATETGGHVFISTNDALDATNDTDGVDDVYDVGGGAKDLLTDNRTGLGFADYAAITDDGGTVVMTGDEPLDPAADTDTSMDVYVARPFVAPPPPTPPVTPPSSAPSGSDPGLAPATTSQEPVPQQQPALTRPVEAKSFNIQPISGTVRVQLPGTKKFVPIAQVTSIPNGTIVDATKGKVRLYTTNGKGGIQFADFYQGIFKVTQLKGGMVELTLAGGDFSTCPGGKESKTRRALAAIGKSVRKLWGSGSGQFRTKGRYAAATIRGTTWLTDDRCDGTLVKVTVGAVTVRDTPKKKSVVVKAPKQYFAKAPAKSARAKR
jgi:hypothetical protein